MTAKGCRWITGTTKRGEKIVNVFCNKIPAKNSDFCPKHVLFYEDEQKEPARAKARREARKQAKKERMEALAASPLRAHNPKFDKPVRMDA